MTRYLHLIKNALFYISDYSYILRQVNKKCNDFVRDLFKEDHEPLYIKLVNFILKCGLIDFSARLQHPYRVLFVNTLVRRLFIIKNNYESYTNNTNLAYRNLLYYYADKEYPENFNAILRYKKGKNIDECLKHPIYCNLHFPFELVAVNDPSKKFDASLLALIIALNDPSLINFIKRRGINWNIEARNIIYILLSDRKLSNHANAMIEKYYTIALINGNISILKNIHKYTLNNIANKNNIYKVLESYFKTKIIDNYKTLCMKRKIMNIIKYLFFNSGQIFVKVFIKCLEFNYEPAFDWFREMINNIPNLSCCILYEINRNVNFNKLYDTFNEKVFRYPKNILDILRGVRTKPENINFNKYYELFDFLDYRYFKTTEILVMLNDQSLIQKVIQENPLIINNFLLVFDSYSNNEFVKNSLNICFVLSSAYFILYPDVKFIVNYLAAKFENKHIVNMFVKNTMYNWYKMRIDAENEAKINLMRPKVYCEFFAMFIYCFVKPFYKNLRDYGDNINDTFKLLCEAIEIISINNLFTILSENAKRYTLTKIVNEVIYRRNFKLAIELYKNFDMPPFHINLFFHHFNKKNSHYILDFIDAGAHLNYKFFKYLPKNIPDEIKIEAFEKYLLSRGCQFTGEDLDCRYYNICKKYRNDVILSWYHSPKRMLIIRQIQSEAIKLISRATE